MLTMTINSNRSTKTAARNTFKLAAAAALAAGLGSAALAQPMLIRAHTQQRFTDFDGPHFGLGTVGLEQIDWVGPFTPTTNSNWGRFTFDFAGREGLFYLNVMVGNQWVIRNMGVSSPMGPGAHHTISTFFPIAPFHGIPVEMVQLDLIATTAPIVSPNPQFIPPSMVIDSFFDVFYTVQSQDLMLGSEWGWTNLPLPVLMAPPAAPAGPTDSAELPDQDKIDNKPQKPNECAPGAVSNSLRYLAARGIGNLGTAPISISGVGGILGTDENGTPQDWPTRKQAYFNAHPEYRICTEIVAGAGPAAIAKVVQAIRDGKDVELDLDGHVCFVAGIRVYADRVELDVYDDDQTDDKKDPKRTVVLKSDGAGGWTCDGMKVDGFVIEAPCRCPADWNHDGVVTPADMQLFLALFQTNQPGADFNGDGVVDSRDLNAFVQAFNTPC